MSELYMIVLQGKEELGNDPEAIKLWSELSGIDVESIDENTPFDIEIADKLLRTLPEVIERLKHKKKEEIEKVEKGLETLIESKESREEEDKGAGQLVEALKEEITKEHVFEIGEETEEEKEEIKEEVKVEKSPKEIEVHPTVKFLLSFENGEFKSHYGDPEKYLDTLKLLTKSEYRSFHISFHGDFTIYGENTGNRWIIAGIEEKHLGVVKVIFKDLKAQL